MIKQKLLLTALITFGVFIFVAFSNEALAGASATVSWTPPNTDQGGGALTGLAGYRVYYDTSSHWTSSCPLGAGSYVNVSGGSASSYHFNNNLTAGQRYYFTVVAYDTASTPNISGCATVNGSGATEVNRFLSYSGDLDYDGDIDVFDYNTLHQYYNTSNSAADIDKDGTVGIFDYNILHGNYGATPLTIP